MDRDADFATFYEVSWSRTVACSLAVLGDLGAAEEVAQEAYTRAWTRWRRLRRYDDPAAWVRHVATRQAISRLRRHGTARRHLEQAPTPPAVSAPDELTVALVAALRRIPEAQRRAIVLFHLGDLSVREIADVEGCAEGTVKARLSRGRAALAPLLSTTFEEVNDV